MRLLETDASKLDAELLEIYLTEAGEVIDAVAASSAQLKAHPDDREALRTVRRGFHTLKGSGRMVGLTDLGELAFEVEKVHNRIIEEDLPVTPAVLELVETAHTSFRAWVDSLRRHGRVTPDAKELHAAIAKVYAELPGAPDPPPASRAAPTPPPPASLAPADAAGASSETDAPAPPSATIPAEEQSAADATARVDAPPPPLAMALTAHDGLPMIEILELDESGASETTSSNDETTPYTDEAEVIEFVPRALAAHVAPDSPAPSPAGAFDAEETTVGDVTLSTALYRILCEEAQQHLATLDAELQTLQFDQHGVAVSGYGARQPHVVRHPSHRRLPAGRVDSESAGAMPARDCKSMVHHCRARRCRCSRALSPA